MNKRTLVIPVFVFVMFSVSVSAQTGFYRSPAGKIGIGIGYQRYRPPKRTEAPFRFNAQTILGNLDYIFNSDLKMSLLPGISFFEANTQIPYEIAPSPSIDLRFLNVNDMNMTGLRFFILGGFRTQYTNIVRSWDLPLHSVNMSIRGGMGLLHTLETNYVWSLKPFFGMFYTQAWNNVSTTEKVHVNTTQNFFTGEAGLEVELSPTMSAIGSVEFSFESSELLYRFGLNFHQASLPKIQNEVISSIRKTDTSSSPLATRLAGIDFEPEPGVTAPEYKFRVEPLYPVIAKNRQIEGEVVLETTINEQGIPLDIVALTNLGFGLETASIEALQKTTFYPAMKDGKMMSKRVTLRYRFTLRNTN